MTKRERRQSLEGRNADMIKRVPGWMFIPRMRGGETTENNRGSDVNTITRPLISIVIFIGEIIKDA